MTVESIIPFLSAAGIGGIIGGVLTSFLQSWLSRRATFDERKFREKKAAYVSLLHALHKSEVDQTPEAAKLVGHWKNVCELVASPDVRLKVERLFETNPLKEGDFHPERPPVLFALKQAMRVDLGIEPR
ncbi:hypothetical protein [Rhodoblastus sp.]|uniref:hypothetical protein n=1 Tax=Rhodoblastus sp. TaxID=1962975 RepID=UPI003F9C9FCB